MQSGRLHSDKRRSNPWKREVEPKPRMVRVADGMAGRLDKRHRATGNGQVPIVASLAWEILGENASVQRSADPKPNTVR